MVGKIACSPWPQVSRTPTSPASGAGADSNSRWHLTHDVPTAKDVTTLLEVIDDPGRPPFLG
ncbi:MAG: hypothetical protein JO281_11950 [Pseudonocardiales bacterium]|nr:hypothetical protein [Pseudonocardiales bacterium]